MTNSVTNRIQLSKLILPFLLFLIIVFFLWCGLSVDPHRIPSPLIGKPVPKFVASTLDNKPFVSNKDFLGHVSVLNVFATWCLSCRAEHPILMDLHNNGLVTIYGLNYKDSRDMTEKWLAQYGNPYTTVIEDPLGSTGIQLGVYGTPETFLIDRNGVIRYKFIGPISVDELQHVLIPKIKMLQRELM